MCKPERSKSQASNDNRELSVPQKRYFLGLHIGHDRAITVADDTNLVFHTAVERLDRKKHSDSFHLPVEEIKTVLLYLNVDVSELRGVCISYLAVDASRVSMTLEASFRDAFPDFEGRFSALDHHLAHALGAKVCSGFDEALVVVADGAGDQRLWGSQSETIYHVSSDTFYLLDERVQSPPLTYINRPEFYDPSYFRPDDQERQISLGLKYEQITYLCGFGPGQAGQTMALAAFGKPLFDYRNMLPKDLSFSLRYTDFLREFEALARADGLSLIQFAKSRRSDIAATYQAYLSEALSAIVKDALDRFPSKRVCFSGGLFLNCLSNRRLHDEHPDRELFFFPACNDEGQSIGTAAYAYWQEHSRLPRRPKEFPYLGREFSDAECEAALNSLDLQYDRLSDDSLLDRLVDLLSAGNIVGLLRGRSECGPRALGHRSILADPRSMESKRRLDEGIKRRAEFRPYAPMILKERSGEVTDFVESAPHMLVTASVKPLDRDRIPSVVHVDGSTRVQTVGSDDDLWLRDLLERFNARTGVPVLLNTSFNDEVQPMVDSPSDAIDMFRSTDLDVLVLGNCLHLKRG
nr:carbamoyltransferase C-terminal domain-containing protein [Ruegeria sp. PR1b]